MTALLLLTLQIVQRARQRKHAVAQANDEYRLPLLPFGLVHGAQADEFLFAG